MSKNIALNQSTKKTLAICSDGRAFLVFAMRVIAEIRSGDVREKKSQQTLEPQISGLKKEGLSGEKSLKSISKFKGKKKRRKQKKEILVDTETSQALDSIFGEYGKSHVQKGGEDFLARYFKIKQSLLRASLDAKFCFYMNLPGENIDFLDSVDLSIFDNSGKRSKDLLELERPGNEIQIQKEALKKKNIKLHFVVTCFEETEETPEETSAKAKIRVEQKLSVLNGTPEDPENVKWSLKFLNFREIKNVSSSKTMLSVSFMIEILSLAGEELGKSESSMGGSDGSLKKIKQN